EPELSERRADAAERYPGVVRVPAENETADHHIVPGLDKPAGADVCQLRIYRLVIVVHFHQPNAGGLSLAGEDGRVRARGERCHNHGFAVVTRLENTSFDLTSFRAVFPIVVRRD